MNEITIPSTKKTLRISEAELLALKNRSRAGRKRRPIEEAVDLEGEVWGSIQHTDEYFFSNLGRVKKDVELKSGKRQCILIRPSIYNDNYSVAITLNNGYRVRTSVARLVLMAFKPHPDQDELFPVNLDGDHSNNRIENLAWKTKKERKEYLYTSGERRPKLKVKQYYNKLGVLKMRKVAFSDTDLKKIKELYSLGYTQSSIAKLIGATQQYVSEVLLNRINYVQ
jgi:hypothetical protein